MDEDGYETCGVILGLFDQDRSYRRVFEFLVSPPDGSMLNTRLIILSTNSAKNREPLALNLLPIFRAAGKSKGFQLLQLLMDLEVDNVNDSFEVFRNNSVASTAFVSYAKSTSMFSALEKAMLSCIKAMHGEIIENSGVDERETSETITRKYVKEFMRSALDLFIDHQDKDFLRLCYILSKSVEEKFKAENCSLSSLCSYIFLRLINPSMLDQCNIYIEQTRMDREQKNQIWKPLLYVAKIVQTIANRAAHRVFEENQNEKWHSDKYQKYEDVIGEEVQNAIKFIQTFVYKAPGSGESLADFESDEVNLEGYTKCSLQIDHLMDIVKSKKEEYEQVHRISIDQGCAPFLFQLLGLR